MSGVVYAALAFTLWGLFPAYFRLQPDIDAIEVLAHRVVWSLVFVAGLLAIARRPAWIGQALRSPRVLLAFVASATLLSANWLTYIWAVNHDHVVDASLGYFITPLINVLFGCTLLRERLRPAQWVALGLAGLGVVWLTVQGRSVPWIALVLATTFGFYGLIRKTAALGALEGLALETTLLLPPALLAIAHLVGSGTGHFADDPATSAWLIGIGPITAIPLLLFAAGARRISMTTLGLLQYISPTLTFLLGIWLFREPFVAAKLVGFAAIWLALGVYSVDGWRSAARVSSQRSPAPQH